MHVIQKAILELFGSSKNLPLKLRWIAREVGEEHPQKIKYHIQQLEKKGMLVVDHIDKKIVKCAQSAGSSFFVSLPIMGSANCGRATALAENSVEGFLKLSKTLLAKAQPRDLFVLRAVGDSMNDAYIGGRNIEDGDYLIVEKTEQVTNNGDCVVSIIDVYANVKNFFSQADEITLMSNSKGEYPPIIIHKNDPYQIAGTVIKVIKNS